MIKTVGAAMVICATASLGISSVIDLRRRTHFISDIIISLERIKSEICTSILPMRDVMENMAAGSPKSTRPFFTAVCGKMSRVGEETFGELWRSSVTEQCGLLSDEERTVLSELGDSLGKYDMRWQEAAIDRTLKRFETFLRNAEKVRDRDSRVHTFLGISAGVFAVIVFI